MKHKYLFELKTTSQDCGPGSLYWRRLTLDNQVSMYMSAAKDMGHDVAGVVYDVVRKTGLRPLGKGTETPDSYEQRIIQQIGEDPARYYQRGTIVRTADEIREHDSDMWQTAEIINSARKSARWPRYVGSCTDYNTTCDYWDVCANGADIQNDTMFSVSRQPDDGKRHLQTLSSSAISTWRQCPRKFYYSQELRRRRVWADGKPLWFGKLLHKAIETYNVLRSDTSAGASFGVEAALAELYVEGRNGADMHDIAHARALVRGYHAMWADDGMSVVATEKPFVRALRDPETGEVSKTYELVGRVDAIVEMP